MEASISLDPSDEPSPLHHPKGEAQVLERLRTESLSALTDKQVQQYEAGCFERFHAARTNAEKDTWIHAMADALVELSNRCIPLTGAKA